MMMHVLWAAAVLMSSGVITQKVDKNNASLTLIPTVNLTNLTDLILSHNSIEMTSSDVKSLQEYPCIRVLDLSYNLIKTLPPRAFHKLTNIETLKLRGNRLQTLDQDIFEGLTKLKSLDLEENPWNCSCSLAGLIKRLNDSGISIGKGVGCYTFHEHTVCSSQETTANTSRSTDTALNSRSSSPSAEPSNSSHVSSSSKEFIGSGDGTQTGSNSWKFLLGVVVLTLSTSLLIVCAVKSPSWYKLLFNYRHQRLHEDVEHNVFNTGRFSNFSLDTEQTETSAQELDEGLDLQPFDDDDGFIEDVYIEPANYSQNADSNES